MSHQPLSAEVLLTQKECCGCVCHNCPYLNEDGQRQIAGTATLNTEFLAFLEEYPGAQWADFMEHLANADEK